VNKIKAKYVGGLAVLYKWKCVKREHHALPVSSTFSGSHPPPPPHPLCYHVEKKIGDFPSEDVSIYITIELIEGGGGAWGRIIRPQESLAINHLILSVCP
jgi:hypothetical protein